ncbi:MAG: tetratricopeptide repeat protein [Planctomycetes bacterium]|nr:tetratricopeptide repeat protein [Planctomycetota bacterium]
MIGTRLGAFRVEAPLGTGGMGVVYRAVAQDGAPVPVGTPVAVKAIHPHLAADPDHVARFLREAEVGRRVVHENVVRTLDAGTTEVGDAPVRWIAMELVEGRTLRRLLEDLGRVPEALVREIGLQAARGLAAVHAAGIVHRDVKPENLLVTADHRVRLMDLGVARLDEGGASLTRTGAFAGSLLYAAPEQVRGDVVGPAADLYALGLVLFELAAGAHPFGDGSVAAVLEAHLRRTPERLDRVVPEVSPFLAEVVARLVAKDPAARPPSAAALVALLEAGEAGAWWRDHATRGTLPEAPPRVPVAHDAPLVGREGALDALRGFLAEARAGAGRVVLLEGEPGIGKTRLLDAFFVEAGPREARSLYGAVGPGGGAEGVAEALLGALGGDGAEATLRGRLGLPAPLAAAFAAHLRRDAPPPGVEALRGDALHATWAQVVKALGAERPVVLAVDDVHRAGLEVWSLVRALVRALPGTRAMLVLAGRPPLPETDVEALEKSGALRRVALPRLPREGVRAVLDRALGSRAVAERLADAVLERTDGVPLFVLEVARQLRESGAVRVEGTGGGTVATVDLSMALAVPRAVREVVLARLRDVRREERDLLDAASVQGVGFDADLVARALDARRVRVLQDLAELERRTGLVRAAGRGHRFDHPQVQATLLEELAPALREEYHALTAEAAAERAGADAARPDALPDDAATDVVAHALSGSRPALALPWLDRVLVRLDRAGRVEDALDVSRRALAVAGLLDDPTRLHVLLRSARFLELCGRKDGLDDAFAEAGAVAARIGTPAARSRVGSMRGRSYWVRGRFPDARAPLDAALADARAAGDPALEATAERGLGLLDVSVSRLDDAERHFQRYLELSRATGDGDGEAMALGNLGLVADQRGRRDEARERYEACRAAAERLGARRTAATAVGNLALVDLAQGRHARAEEGLRRYLDLAREVAERPQAAYAYVNLGVTLLRQGAWEEARAALDSCLVECETTGQRRVESYARDRVGLVLAATGDLDGARAWHEASLAIRREIAYPSGQGHSLHHLGVVAARRGDRDAATAAFDAALALARERGFVGLEALVLADRAAWSGGDADAALAAAARTTTLDVDDRLHVLVQVAQATGRDDLRREARALSDRLLEGMTPARRATAAARVEDHLVAQRP